jgi:D-glycero-D-manno-heptose 1,7-bisphosphate phosphatase
MVLLPWAADAIRRLNAAGLPVVVVTNQGGVAFGFLTEDDLRRIHERMASLLAELDAHVDRVYYCPHHPQGTVARYARACPDRKPGTGMLARASRELGIDLRKAVLIGDSPTDIVAGRRAGCITIRVGGGSPVPEGPELDYAPEEAIPDFERLDLGGAVDFLLEALDPGVSWLLP